MAVAVTLWGALPALAEPNEPVGRQVHVKQGDLPRPFATESVANGARVVARPADAGLNLPPGFVATLFAEGLSGPRWMTVAENGDVILAESAAGRLRVLADRDGDGRAELNQVLIDGLDRPHGLAIQGGYLYVGEPGRIVRFAYRAGDSKGKPPVEAVTAPGALGDGSGHWTCDIVFQPDGKAFYVSVGSRGNTAEEPLPRASVQLFAADGSGQRTFASGLRNAIGIAFHPLTGELYASVNERDRLGDGLVPDYLARLVDGGFYGWPYAYLGPNPDPNFGARRPDLVARTIAPDVLFDSHSAPIGMVFYNGQQFPPEYQGDAFIAFQGSWNSAKPTGHKVVRVPFKDGRPTGVYENFVTGFWFAGRERAVIWGRPAGLAIAKDGSLLIADDAGGTLWRVSYQQPR